MEPRDTPQLMICGRRELPELAESQLTHMIYIGDGPTDLLDGCQTVRSVTRRCVRRREMP